MTDLDAVTLDEILALPDPGQATTTADTATTTTPPDATAANRDDHGRFAPKATTEPEAPAVDATAETKPTPGMVPQPALHAAREGERTAKAESDDLRRQLQQMQGKIDLLTTQRTQPATPVEPAKAPDFWENPDAFVGHALTPIQQALQTQKLEFSRMMAETKFGDDVVAAADAALGEMARTNRTEATRIAQQMAQSKNPYADLVGWHKDQQTRQRVGTDPDAFVKSELDRLLADPAEAAKILERIQHTANTTADRSAPAIKLPPSLNKLPGGANSAPGGSMSNEDIYAHATGRG